MKLNANENDEGNSLRQNTNRIAIFGEPQAMEACDGVSVAFEMPLQRCDNFSDRKLILLPISFLVLYKSRCAFCFIQSS